MSSPVPGDAEKKAYELAVDVVKQLIALATGITTVSVTFMKDAPPPALRVAWVLYLLSVAIGIFAIGKLSGNLARHKDFDIYAHGASAFPVLQQALFIVATACAIAGSWRPAAASTTCIPVCAPPTNSH